jgi:hypothetical protein
MLELVIKTNFVEQLIDYVKRRRKVKEITGRLEKQKIKNKRLKCKIKEFIDQISGNGIYIFIMYHVSCILHRVSCIFLFIILLRTCQEEWPV